MMCSQLAMWLHTIDPYAIKLWEGGPIRWYGLSYLLGFYLGYLAIRRICKAGLTTVKLRETADLVGTLAIGAVVGGRVGYALFYQPELLWTFQDHAPWWSLLAINQGGMASHGGMIGLILGCCYYAWRHHHNPRHLMDLAAFAA
ncbi:MAG: prolipoprotein diacylglyceryl transferase, partial [Phycisphaeraceae bacterium]|nr:prolipoprotein diacylglyceryl transferase [Phycisphaeraceae bacterium]